MTWTLERRHVVGSAIFGVGWAVSAACPGPIVAQLGAGIAWGVATSAGLVLGIGLYLARHGETPERGVEAPPVVA